jgi:uncharacterized lipoprotein YbaY
MNVKSLMCALRTVACLATIATLSADLYGQSSWADSFRSALPSVPGFGTPSSPSSMGIPYSSTSTPASFGSGRRDWKLGVNIQNTESGAVVTAVAPNSPAQQANISPGDVIVAVGSSRLGIVDGRIVELADELRKFTDNYGRINVLLFDSRSRTLRSANATLSSNASSITGVIALRDGQILPTGSTLILELRNATQPIFEVAGGKSSTQIQGIGPYPFELNVDPRYISPTDQYELMAAIFLGNQQLYSLTQPVRLNAGNMNQPLSMTLERFNGSVSSGSSVSAAYPNMGGTDQITQLFLQIIGKPPTTAELLGWQSYLNQGRSIDELRFALLSSNKYRERFRGDDGVYLQNLIRELTNRTPSQQELAYWIGRLQATGSTSDVAKEIMAQRR